MTAYNSFIFSICISLKEISRHIFKTYCTKFPIFIKEARVTDVSQCIFSVSANFCCITGVNNSFWLPLFCAKTFSILISSLCSLTLKITSFHTSNKHYVLRKFCLTIILYIEGTSHVTDWSFVCINSKLIWYTKQSNLCCRAPSSVIIHFIEKKRRCAVRIF